MKRSTDRSLRNPVVLHVKIPTFDLSVRERNLFADFSRNFFSVQKNTYATTLDVLSDTKKYLECLFFRGCFINFRYNYGMKTIPWYLIFFIFDVSTDFEQRKMK
jgi:hypothetical protein